MNALKVIFGTKQNSDVPSLHSDPFKSGAITDVNISYSKFWNPEHKWTGYIKFKVGATSGKHDFKGADPSEILEQMKTFLESLPTT